VSNTNNYIITTLSSGSSEYVDSSDVQIQAPFSIGAPSARNLRLTGAPYVSSTSNPSSIFSRQIINTGGGDIPESIIARDNLSHWWKLTDDPAEGEVLDYGTSATAATNLAVVDASTATGPTELGSPTVFSFDGVNDIVKTQIIDADGGKNSIADLMDSNYYTISFWMKDNGVVGDEVCWTNSGYWESNTLRDGGQGFFNQSWGGLYIYWRPAYSATHWLKSTGVTGWKHYAIVTDLRQHAIDASLNVGIGYVDAVARPDDLTWGDVQSAYVAGAENYWFAIGGFASGSLGAGEKWAPIDVCDFRMYDRLLTPTEISNIAAGDWT